jgi:uncharacterized delta-60 repeat protein
VQPDGKALIAGSFTLLDLEPRNGIARLNTDGSPDSTFDPQDGPDGNVYAMAYQADGKVVIGGAFTYFNGVACKHVARLMPDGALDLSFDTSDGPNGDVLCLGVQPDGQVVIGGTFTAVGGVPRPGIARLNSDIAVPVAPVITSEPEAIEVASGGSARFAVEATGTLPLFYRWFKDGVGLDGATNAVLGFSRVQPSDAGAYSVLVTNMAGRTSSRIVALVVDGKPVLMRQPTDQSAGAGESVQFVVEATGPGALAFGWQHDGIGLLDGDWVSGARTARLTLRNLDLSDAGNYSVWVSNSWGLVTSRAAKLRVFPPNDNFSAAISIPPLGGRAIGSSHGATKETGEPNHAGDAGGKSVWYTWVPSLSGPAVIDTWGSSFDTLLAVYRGASIATLELVAANDDGMGFEGNSVVELQAQAGVIYWLAIDGYQDAQGQIVLNCWFQAPVFGPVTLAEDVVRLQLLTPPGSLVVVESSEDLLNWTPLTTNVAPHSGLLQWGESRAPNTGQRFFRAVSR